MGIEQEDLGGKGIGRDKYKVKLCLFVLYRLSPKIKMKHGFAILFNRRIKNIPRLTAQASQNTLLSPSQPKIKN